MLPNWFCSIISVSPRIKKKGGGGGGLSTLKLFMPGPYIASLYYYPVLCEHGKRGGGGGGGGVLCCSLPDFLGVMVGKCGQKGLISGTCWLIMPHTFIG